MKNHEGERRKTKHLRCKKHRMKRREWVGSKAKEAGFFSTRGSKQGEEEKVAVAIVARGATP